MSVINHLHHVGISVPSLDEARRYYVGLLGFVEVGEGDFANDPEIDAIMGLEGGAAKAIFLSFGDFKIEMFEFAAPAQQRDDAGRPVSRHGISHFCLDVTDVRALHGRLKAAGMRFHSDPIDKAGVRTCYGRDPFGNVIEFQEIISGDPTVGEVLA